ncbi:MAG TPA: hypothetical protein VJM31_01905 [Vicinamibacterales bacterium]|nr:hypothetical protein [Vicinamibacterales bacterium]
MTDTRSLLKWNFVRQARVLTCEIRANGSQSYDVCVLPHWDVGSTVIEPYDRLANALGRHAQLASYFREHGWKIARDSHLTAA